jgi:hypothetical protein
MTTSTEPVKFVKPNITPDDLRPFSDSTRTANLSQILKSIVTKASAKVGLLYISLSRSHARTRSSSHLAAPKTHSTGSNRTIPDGK